MAALWGVLGSAALMPSEIEAAKARAAEHAYWDGVVEKLRQKRPMWDREWEAAKQGISEQDQKEMDRQTRLKQLEEEYWRSKQAPAGPAANGDK